MSDVTDRTAGEPPPHCPVCGIEMTLTTEQRDGEDWRVWVCQRFDEHNQRNEHPTPPGNTCWWEQIPPH